MTTIDRDFNHGRYDPASPDGFYESYFLRANHPSRPLAFWIRYTVFSPKGRPRDAIGELWAIVFDGEHGAHVVAKTEIPSGGFAFARDRLAVRIGTATLRPGALSGTAESRGHRIGWQLTYEGPEAPVLALDRALYAGAFPRAKSLVAMPLARFRGALVVDGAHLAVDDWIGSQNHNWGSRHTDRYAYGQVAGFDNAPGSFLEIATARVKLGPVWTPRLTPLVLRHDGREYALNTIGQSLRARARYSYFDWTFRSERAGTRIDGRIHAPREAFVGLRYYNPPGGEKYCLNSKIAACELTLARPGQAPQVLRAAHRCAFEILADDLAHGVEIRT